MELLSVKVRRGRLGKAADAFQTYVVLKVQNLKGTTIDRRGSEPCWEQDFMFEVCADGKGFIIELWKKGLLWDSILGVLWIPLATVEYATEFLILMPNAHVTFKLKTDMLSPYTLEKWLTYRVRYNSEGPGTWWTLHSEVIKNGSEIQGTKTPTSHEVLLDVYFALPFDTHKDLDCRGWHRRTPLQCIRHSHQDTDDSLSSMESGLSIQESRLRRNKDQADGSNFAKARWARAIQKD